MLHAVQKLSRVVDTHAFNVCKARTEDVVTTHRRDGDEQPHRRSNERFGNAGSDCCQGNAFQGGNCMEGVHDAPHRTEKADEGSSVGRSS